MMSKKPKSPRPEREENPEWDKKEEDTFAWDPVAKDETTEDEMLYITEKETPSENGNDSDGFGVDLPTPTTDYISGNDDFEKSEPSQREPEYPNPNPPIVNPISFPPSPVIFYDPERTYFFIFGPGSVGKTVLIGSIYRYLKNIRGLKGDKLSNINDVNKPHEKKGNELLNEITKSNHEKIFVQGSNLITDSEPVPRHINLRFEPVQRKKPPFEFCFMDIAGENLEYLSFDSYNELPPSINVYLEKLPKENLCIIYIIDPECSKLDKVGQEQLFDAFLHKLDANKHDDTPILLLVSKWDLVKDYKDAEDFLKNEYESIWATVNQTGRDFTISEFSIGEVNDDNIDEKIIEKYDPSYPEKVFRWMYKTQLNVDLDDETINKESTFTRFIKKYLK